MKKKVLIVGSAGNCQYGEMFRGEGWEVTQNMDDADVIQFTGGSDVSPELYGCQKHPRTFNSEARDVEETVIYNKAIIKGKPMTGICRGGQFLNVMNGGRMYQHVDGHAIGGTHKIVDDQTGFICDVTSTHHQMMIANEQGRILARPPKSLTTHKDYVDKEGKMYVVEPEEQEIDTEVVYYPQTNVLCFQPHPEFLSGIPCRPYYFASIEGRLLKDWKKMEALLGVGIYDEGDGYIEIQHEEEY